LLDKLFKLPYANTCDSVQGCTIENEYTIFDCNTPYVDRYFIWTAITRTDDLNKVNIFIHPKKEIIKLIKSRYKQYIESKIKNYKLQDKRGGREFNKDEYIDLGWINNELMRYEKRCPICKDFFKIHFENEFECNITVDRINNSKPHVKSNCRLICLHCNVTKK